MHVLLDVFNKLRSVSLIFQTDDTTVPGRMKMQQTKMLMLISMKDEDDFQTQEFVAELDGGPLYRDKILQQQVLAHVLKIQKCTVVQRMVTCTP